MLARALATSAQAKQNQYTELKLHSTMNNLRSRLQALLWGQLKGRGNPVLELANHSKSHLSLNLNSDSLVIQAQASSAIRSTKPFFSVVFSIDINVPNTIIHHCTQVL